MCSLHPTSNNTPVALNLAGKNQDCLCCLFCGTCLTTLCLFFSGCGLVGIVLSQLGPKEVVLTDMGSTMDLLKKNVQSNPAPCALIAEELEWLASCYWWSLVGRIVDSQLCCGLSLHRYIIGEREMTLSKASLIWLWALTLCMFKRRLLHWSTLLASFPMIRLTFTLPMVEIGN